jgi:hypothetical protein
MRLFNPMACKVMDAGMLRTGGQNEVGRIVIALYLVVVMDDVVSR